MKIYGFIIHPACYLKDLHSRNDVERCRVAGNFGFAFFNENATSEIFFFTILDMRIYGELYGSGKGGVGRLLSTHNIYLFMSFIAGCRR